MFGGLVHGVSTDFEGKNTTPVSRLPVPRCPLPIILSASTQIVVWRSGSAGDFGDVRSTALRFLPNRRQKYRWRVASYEMAATLEEGHIILLADFQRLCARHERDGMQYQL